MTLLAVTSQTWLVTGLGFGLVLVLLFVFVYIMKFLGWIMQLGSKPEKAATAVAVPADNAPVASTEDDDLAAVSYALHLYYHAHDAEPAHITVHPHHTMWNNNL